MVSAVGPAAVLTVAACLATTVVSPSAQARPKRAETATLSARASSAAILAGATVTVSGRSRGDVRGSVSLLEASGKSWTVVDRMRPSTRAYSFTLTPAAGAHTYRISQHAARGGVATSPTVAVSVATPAPVSPAIAAARSRILADTNAYRQQNGLAPLVETSGVDAVAQAWSEQMAATGAFEHNPSYAGQMPSGWTRAGENIAYGYAPETVGAAWYASPGHKANMLGDYTTIGIGYAVDANGRGYFTQDFGKY